MGPTEFKIITASKESLYVVKKSKFIAYASYAPDVQSVQLQLDQIKKIHNKAGHHCFGFRIGLDGNQFRSNDDGEPSGTAGRPILGQIDSFGLTNTLIVVVRYFGGIKLGASGLTSAYKTAARQVLSECTIITKQVTRDIKIKTDHQHIGILMTKAKKLGFLIGTIEYDPVPCVTLSAPIKGLQVTLDKLKAQVMNISIAEAQTIEASDVFYILDV